MGVTSGWNKLPAMVFLTMLGSLPAFALTWYSYREPGGRIVVVDDLEKVPPDCRDSVRAERVGRSPRPIDPGKAPSRAVPGDLVPTLHEAGSGPVSDTGFRHSSEAGFKSSHPAMTLRSDEADLEGSSGHSTLEVPDEGDYAEVSSAHGSNTWSGAGDETASETPEMRAERVFIASAGLCLQELSGLQDRGELIWNIARRLGPNRPELRFQHSQGLATLAGPWMSWASQADHEKYREWIGRVRTLIDQYRTLFYTISQRLMTNPAALNNELAPLLNRVRVQLEWVKQNRPLPLAR